MSNTHLTLRLPVELARALARRARDRGVPKSQLAREAVTRYLAGAPNSDAGRPVSGADLAARWAMLPRLTAAEAEHLAADVAMARTVLPPVIPPWE